MVDHLDGLGWLEERSWLPGVIWKHTDGVLRLPTQHAQHCVFLDNTYKEHCKYKPETSQCGHISNFVTLACYLTSPSYVYLIAYAFMEIISSEVMVQKWCCATILRIFLTWYSSTTENVYSCLAITWSQFLQTSARGEKHKCIALTALYHAPHTWNYNVSIAANIEKRCNVTINAPHHATTIARGCGWNVILKKHEN